MLPSFIERTATWILRVAERGRVETIVLVTSPKPFSDPTISRIQMNALRSWRALGDAVDVVIVGDEPGAAAAAQEIGCRFIPEVERNASGTPLIRSIFDRARAASAAPVVAYANADIILLDDFVDAVAAVSKRLPRFLLASRRWDLPVEFALAIDEGWQDRLRESVRRDGRLHPPGGSDLFVFPRACFAEVPDLAVGRAGWDNWMLYEARRRRWPVVDLSRRITVIHQDHDYRHLPEGRPHYRLPETDENIRLAGGRRAILSLRDADWEWSNGKAQPKPVTPASVVRSIELFPLLRLRSPALAHVAFALAHPGKALGELRGWLAWKIGRPGRGGRPENLR